MVTVILCSIRWGIFFLLFQSLRMLGLVVLRHLQLSLSLDELLVQHTSVTYVEITEVDLMLGQGIYDGDLLIVDRHITAQHGADFILLIVNSRLSI